MKQQDIAVVIVIVFFAGIFSFFLSSKFFSSGNKQQMAEVVQGITPEFVYPEEKHFNLESINPTRLIEIAPNTNDQPFINQ